MEVTFTVGEWERVPWSMVCSEVLDDETIRQIVEILAKRYGVNLGIDHEKTSEVQKEDI